MTTTTSGERPADLIARLGLTADDLVVEVGSRDGTRLREVKACGPRVLGVEPNVQLMARAFAAGVDTLAAYFSPGVAGYIRRKYGPVRLLLVHDAAAFGDPAAAAACLAPGGRWLFTGPLPEAPLRRAA